MAMTTLRATMQHSTHFKAPDPVPKALGHCPLNIGGINLLVPMQQKRKQGSKIILYFLTSLNILPEVDHHVKLKNIKNFLTLCLTLLPKHSHLVSFGVFVTLWTVAHQDSLSREMEFSRQKYWSGLSFPSPKGCVASPSGNRTWVSHVTGRDTQHYTNKDGKTPLFPKHLLTRRLSECFQRTFLGFTLCLVF